MKQIKVVQSTTYRDNITDKHLAEVNREKMVTPEEEIELAVRIKSGDKKAETQLVNANLRFVITVAKQYQNQGLELNDLISEGNIGLIKAARRFDETRGFKFISFAVWWIKQTILQAIYEKGRIVRLPMNRITLIKNYKKTASKLEQLLGHMPSSDEVFEVMDVTDEEKKIILTNMGSHTSLDNPLSDDGDSDSMVDMLEDDYTPPTDNGTNCDSLRTDMMRVIETLEPREVSVLTMLFGINCREFSLQEIADELKYTPERIRQIREEALRKMRGLEKSRLLRKYVA